MNWVLVPQQLVTGILSGGTLGLIALGIVLIYRSSEVFNFAHGHMVMLGAFFTWWFAGGTGAEAGIGLGLPFPLAVIAALICAIVIGLLIERLALRPMTGQPLLSIVLVTLGLAQLMEGLATVMFGTQPKGFPSPIDRTATFLLPNPFAGENALPIVQNITIKQAPLATFVIALVVALLFMAFFNYTSLGLAMKATSENHELASSVGIKVPRVFGISWAIAGIVATLGGILLAMLTGASLSLATVALVAFPAILLGGLESFPGALLGGLIVGMTQEMVKASIMIEVRNSAEIAPYILLLVILLFRPEGLFGQKRIERI